MEHREAAFRKLFDLYRHDIYAYGKSILKHDEYAEEIVQDVFLKIWLNREKLDPELSFRSYIFAITRNLAINFLHKAANDARLREEVFYKSQESYNPAENNIDAAYYDRIKQQAIDILSPRRRQIFELSRNRGMSYEEISKELGISVSTVKNQMSAALETIRNFLFAHSDLTLIITFIAFGWL
ncbi:RNA polymerase sigma-70 factor [Sinomicrobium sp. FJxs]|uniref:RNA polymerase sigma factor n=2 Tax=Sinomicrobium weinanense TaxID=2842200 RepID=A0A926Q2I2_9FLAO|nr:RNA polymerase sigma-70 factor [Sinomicrobium weinanense]MBC9796553.1 RNA polymerase sigma-70 factor [Sinomicrobium weinanense]MBU3123060.1 RNA polymerase sigma-70 factor [Sinomicrobium weinanense]